MEKQMAAPSLYPLCSGPGHWTLGEVSGRPGRAWGSGRRRLRLSWFPGTAQLQASSPFRFLPTLLSPPLGIPSSTAGAFTSRAICPAVPPRASQGVAVPSSLQLAGVVHRAPPPCRELPTPAPPERQPLQGLVQLTRGGHSPGSQRCSTHAACACMGARGTAEPSGFHCPGAGPPAPVPPELGPRGCLELCTGVPVRGPSLVGPSLPAVGPELCSHSAQTRMLLARASQGSAVGAEARGLYVGVSAPSGHARLP